MLAFYYIPEQKLICAPVLMREPRIKEGGVVELLIKWHLLLFRLFQPVVGEEM